MAEYEQRERRIPDQLGALISAFAISVNEAHQQNQMGFADYVQRTTALKNLEWAISVGIISQAQALTMISSIPIASIVSMDQFGFKEATLDAEFRVSASTEENTSVGVNTSTEASIKIGGIAAMFGAGGSVKIKADTTYKKDTRRASDYSSTVKAHIAMERIPPPEGLQKLLDMQNEVVQSAMTINKSIIERQADQLSNAVEESEVPEALPGDDGDGGGTDAEPAGD